MAIRYNTDQLNRYFAPGISEFTSCDAPDITATHPEAPHWLANHYLNSIFRGSFKDKYLQYAVNQMYRAQVAFADYHEARNLTTEFLAKGSPGNPSSRSYFRALARWESCLLNLQIFIDVMNRLRKNLKDEPVFKEDDGTPEQRTFDMANTVKHWASDLFAGRHADEGTVPLWLTNTGLKTHSHEITFHELANLISEVATAANELQDPQSFANPK